MGLVLLEMKHACTTYVQTDKGNVEGKGWSESEVLRRIFGSD
jgi:hypothetical protein